MSKTGTPPTRIDSLVTRGEEEGREEERGVSSLVEEEELIAGCNDPEVESDEESPPELEIELGRSIPEEEEAEEDKEIEPLYEEAAEPLELKEAGEATETLPEPPEPPEPRDCSFSSNFFGEYKLFKKEILFFFHLFD